MKKIALYAMCFAMLFLPACSATPPQNVFEPEPATASPPPPTTSPPTNLPQETTPWPATQSSSEDESPYRTRELSRDGDYKTMEMYVSYNDRVKSRRITFELPIEWRGDGSVFTNDEDYLYTMKVDMWNIIDATRESVLDEYGDNRPQEEWMHVIEENIYSIENYEIFYYKYNYDNETIISSYFLYANEECFRMSSYVFYGNKPEYDSIFKRIVESVKFQF